MRRSRRLRASFFRDVRYKGDWEVNFGVLGLEVRIARRQIGFWINQRVKWMWYSNDFLHVTNNQWTEKSHD